MSSQHCVDLITSYVPGTKQRKEGRVCFGSQFKGVMAKKVSSRSLRNELMMHLQSGNREEGHAGVSLLGSPGPQFVGWCQPYLTVLSPVADVT